MGEEYSLSALDLEALAAIPPQLIACRRARVRISERHTRLTVCSNKELMSFAKMGWLAAISDSSKRVATLIVLIKRLAVAPIPEQPNTTDFRLPLLSLSFRVIMFHGERMRSSRIASTYTLCRNNATHLTSDCSKDVSIHPPIWGHSQFIIFDLNSSARTYIAPQYLFVDAGMYL